MKLRLNGKNKKKVIQFLSCMKLNSGDHSCGTQSIQLKSQKETNQLSCLAVR